MSLKLAFKVFNQSEKTMSQQNSIESQIEVIGPDVEFKSTIKQFTEDLVRLINSLRESKLTDVDPAIIAPLRNNLVSILNGIFSDKN
jgi:hypothetical protein